MFWSTGGHKCTIFYICNMPYLFFLIKKGFCMFVQIKFLIIIKK